jgi:Tfp pilus assembly PilM family ATPase
VRMMMKAGAPGSIMGPLRLLSRPLATLHVEGGSVRLLVVKGRQITTWGVEPLEPELTRDGVVADPEAVGRHIKTLFAAHHIGKGNLVVGLTGQRSVPRILDFPEMDLRLLPEAIPREMKREMPVPLDDIYISWQLVGNGNGHLRVFALGVPRDVLGPQVKAITAAGAKPRSMDIKPLALVRAVGRSEAIIADLEPETLDVIVVQGGIPATIRTVGVRREIDTVEEKVQRLGEDLARTVKFYSDTHPQEPLDPSTPIYLTGSLAQEVASSGVVEGSVRYPVEPLAPALDCPADLPLATFMVNIGLALKEL